MHTTGLASEPIGRLYEGGRLGDALREARARTLGMYAHLDLAALQVPCIAIVNPPLWELAHIAWFQEIWCLRGKRGPGAPPRPSLLPGADAMLDSSAVPHDSRWHLPYPPASVLFDYMEATLQATLDALERASERDRYFFELALLHEDMHGEALLMTLQTLALPAPSLDAIGPPAPLAAAPRDVRLEGGKFLLGSAPDSRRFVFDNEKWAHPVSVAPFAIGAVPVTQGAFAEFVADGGYGRRELWTEAGWAWREAAGREAPLHWRRDAGDWQVRRFDRWHPIDPGAAMVHVSQHEASAWCRWAGRRLPTEAEWEFAARAAGGALSPGGVWEWTASPFDPYPGFSADPYEDYSRPWFGSHRVLRGASFATRPRLAHERFRNFYLPGRNDVFVGFRTCAAER